VARENGRCAPGEQATDRPAASRAHDQEIDLLAEAGQLLAGRSVADRSVADVTFEIVRSAEPGEILRRQLLGDFGPSVLDRLTVRDALHGQDPERLDPRACPRGDRASGLE
jgi:hypothetical protein